MDFRCWLSCRGGAISSSTDFDGSCAYPICRAICLWKDDTQDMTTAEELDQQIAEMIDQLVVEIRLLRLDAKKLAETELDEAQQHLVTRMNARLDALLEGT